ncbi:MAG: ester cyclase [Thaumarchaeota archaeon]|nr:ester cyclase [Nitrososphaerota archaeon]
MSLEQKKNEQLVRARFDAVNAHDWKRFQGLYSDSTVWQDAGLAKAIKGSTAVRKRLEAFAKGFPDFRWQLDRVFGQGEWMCAEFTFTGSHSGPLPFAGMRFLPVTKKSIRISACGVYRIQEGKIVESHVYFDRSRILAQLGIQSPKKAQDR